jgi:hypothetical protein
MDRPDLPAAAATKRRVVASGPVSTTTAATSSATAAVTSATTSAAAAIADHLGETRVNLLLGLCENIHEITSLFGICRQVS